MRGLEASVALGGRLLLAAIFVFEGWIKINDPAGVVAYMEAHHVSGVLLRLAIVAELGGGLAVAFGFLTRVAALGLGSFAVVTALLFHSDFGDPEQVVHFGKNLAIAGGFMMLLAHGPGPWSLDTWRPAPLHRLWRVLGRPGDQHSSSDRPHERGFRLSTRGNCEGSDDQ
jgi:putative oxidoreductase